MNKFIQTWKKNSEEFQRISGKSKIRQLLELLYYRKIHGFSPTSYYIIPIFSELSKRPLISDKRYSFLEKQLNPRQTGVIPFNKWVQSCFWKANGLPHAVTLGFIKKNSGVLNGSVIKVTENELDSFFCNTELPLVIKPLSGANGIGFDIIDKFDQDNKTVTLRQIGELTLNKFRSFLLTDSMGKDGFLIQKYIEQHPEIECFYSNSVNSLRVVTHMDENGDFSVDCALMKFGAGKSITDNNNEDGRVFAFMDIKNGSLGKGFTGAFSQAPIELHPDSKLKIDGYIVPFWQESLELALAAHCHLPFPRHIGWDIAISSTGPLIIELNSFLAISVYQKGGNDLIRKTAFGKSLSL